MDCEQAAIGAAARADRGAGERSEPARASCSSLVAKVASAAVPLRACPLAKHTFDGTEVLLEM